MCTLARAVLAVVSGKRGAFGTGQKEGEAPSSPSLAARKTLGGDLESQISIKLHDFVLVRPDNSGGDHVIVGDRGYQAK